MQHSGKLIESELASAIDCLRFRWPEYLMEAAEVGLYLFLTCVFASLLLSPALDGTLEVLLFRIGLFISSYGCRFIFSSLPWVQGCCTPRMISSILYSHALSTRTQNRDPSEDRERRLAGVFVPKV
jgi:hypothetical protein